MSFTPEDVKKIAHLARLNLSDNDIPQLTSQLSSILDFIEQLNTAKTEHTDPLAHPLDISQRLRPDTITEQDLRDKFQHIAPQVEAGLYLVPKVIEEE
jgi:aspartyl-tRNA(Asn)/glutamyl-tRNA(Gln) amidotransferase subunit C